MTEFSGGGAFSYIDLYNAAAIELDEELQAATEETEEQLSNDDNSLYNLNAILDSLQDE
jgi:hypothetical protein